MFKKTLLAASLAALSAGAMAVDVSTSTAAIYGNEGFTSGLVKNDFSELTLGAVELTLGAEYTVGDTFTITISGGEFDTDDLFFLTDKNGDGGVEITAGLLDATANELLFRITGLSDATTTVGEKLVLKSGVSATPTAVPIKLGSTSVGAKLNVSVRAATESGRTIDSQGSKDSFEIGKVVQQHTFTIKPVMNGVIDVADERKSFAVDANATFNVEYDETTVNQAGFAIADTIYTIKGAMAGFEDTVTGSDNDGTVVGTAGAYTVATDLQSASSTSGAAPAPSEVVLFTVDPTPADQVVLSTSSYTVDVTIKEVGGKSVTYSAIAAGKTSLNGSSAEFAYVPVNFVGAVTSQFEVGNKGTVDGAITLNGFDTAGKDYSAVLPFVAEAGKLTKIGDDDIAKAFGLTKGTKLKLTITVNAPSDDITFGGYSNRGTTGRMSLQQED